MQRGEAIHGADPTSAVNGAVFKCKNSTMGSQRSRVSVQAPLPAQGCELAVPPTAPGTQAQLHQPHPFPSSRASS